MPTPKIISLFTGAGGLDVGLEAAGFETAVAVENDADAVKTLRHNREWPVIDRDIHRVPTLEILENARLREGDADLLVGGPPCQPFSKSGYWAHGDARRLDDPRASTLEAYLRVLRDAKPKAFLLENVSGLAYRSKSEGFDLLQATVESINRELSTGYTFSWAVLNAADYGVPQERERIFIVGHREGRTFDFPKPTHFRPEAQNGQRSLGLSTLATYKTSWDALGDLEDPNDPELRLSGKWADLLTSIPEGGNYLYHTDRGKGLPLFGWRRRYWSFLLKLSKRLPSWTITAQPGSAIGPFHWHNRRLSMRELARLQTFPDDFSVLGPRATYHRQIGNAVPSLLAEVLGNAIADQLLGLESSSRLKLLPPARRPVPPPNPVRSVPAKYLDLVGEHSPHPGTGKGRAAVARAEAAP